MDRSTRRYVVVDHDKIHTAKAVEEWLALHPRVTRLCLPPYCPQANPIERVFGDVHDCCTRNHRRKRLPDLVADVEDHIHLNGPWKYPLSDLYAEPAVSAVVAHSVAEAPAKAAASVYQSYMERISESIPIKRPAPTPATPQGRCLDKGYDYDEVRDVLAEFGFTAPIRARGEEAKALKQDAGFRARRGVVERTHRWMNRFRRVLIRWDKKVRNYLGFLHLACTYIT